VGRFPRGDSSPLGRIESDACCNDGGYSRELADAHRDGCFSEACTKTLMVLRSEPRRRYDERCLRLVSAATWCVSGDPREDRPGVDEHGAVRQLE
jgi:hypothetical protein